MAHCASAVIAFTDDDCIPDAGWLAAGLSGAHHLTDAGAAWGRIIVPLTADPTDWERNVAGLQEAPCATANCFYRRGCWRRSADSTSVSRRPGVKTATCNSGDGYGCCDQTSPSAIVEHPARPAPWGSVSGCSVKTGLMRCSIRSIRRLYQVFNPHEPPWAYYAMVPLMCIGGSPCLWQYALATVAILPGLPGRRLLLPPTAQGVPAALTHCGNARDVTDYSALCGVLAVVWGAEISSRIFLTMRLLALVLPTR